MTITYQKRRKYKYVLLKEVRCPTPIRPDKTVADEFITLDTDGYITIAENYAWDGPSGPTIDTKNFMRGSLIHDAFYQLMREGWIGQEHRLPADKLLRDMCIEDGMSRFCANIVFWAVQKFGGKHALPDSLTAP